MQIRKITIGLMLYGNAIYFRYYANTRDTEDTATFIPIGREIIYTINSISYVGYHDLPIIIYHRYHQLEMIDDEKFDRLVRAFTEQMIHAKMELYSEDGVQIEYIDQEALIGVDGKQWF